MPTYTQAGRLLAVTTPLGKDALLLAGFEGHEAISELFHFRLALLTEHRTPVPFDRIVGQGVTVEMMLPDGGKRFFHGLVRRFTQGKRDATFTYFQAEVVPQLWLLTKKVQSRIFQHLSVPDILKQVLAGQNVKFDILGTYHRRN
jgi:type VI secretion system secreted protein VgrG